MNFSNISSMMCFHVQDGDSSDHYIRFSQSNWVKANGETRSWTMVEDHQALEKAFNEHLQKEIKKYIPFNF